MRRAINSLVVLFLVITAGGVLVVAIHWHRQTAALTQCQNNLKSIALGLHGYHGNYGHFPPGTFALVKLPPEKRLSWLVLITPYTWDSPLHLPDYKKAWDAPENCPPLWVDEDHYSGEYRNKRPVGPLKLFLCPSNPARAESSKPSLTHYVGIAGIGDTAAELPLSDPDAGCFGYDRKVTLADMQHGKWTTIMVIEALDGGPWTAGGKPTVRGLAGDGSPYIGEGGQFASNHGSRTNILFADTSVRALTGEVSSQMIEAMSRLAGNGQDIRIHELPGDP